jgi:hypothetical protein
MESGQLAVVSATSGDRVLAPQFLPAASVCRREAVAACLLLWSGLGHSCTEPTAAIPRTPDVRAFVTERLATTLDSNGHYVLRGLAPPERLPVISESTAVVLAEAFLRTFAGSPAFVLMLERQRGGSVPVATLRPERRVEYADSPYDHLSIDSAALRRHAGPRFVVRFMEPNSAPAVTVAVSLYATNFAVTDGKLVSQPATGGEFRVFATPVHRTYENPVSPERATVEASRATGALVDEIPSLLLPDITYAFQFARWHLVLDRELLVEVIATGRRAVVRSLYVGLSFPTTTNQTALFTPAVAQPEVQGFPLFDGTEYPIRIRGGAPVALEEVRVIPR